MTLSWINLEINRLKEARSCKIHNTCNAVNPEKKNNFLQQQETSFIFVDIFNCYGLNIFSFHLTSTFSVLFSVFKYHFQCSIFNTQAADLYQMNMCDNKSQSHLNKPQSMSFIQTCYNSFSIKKKRKRNTHTQK